MEMILPIFEYSQRLLNSVTPDERFIAGTKLSSYALYNLTAKQNWSNRMQGMGEIVIGLLLAASLLAVAGLYFAIALGITFPMPPVGLVVFSSCVAAVCSLAALGIFEKQVSLGVNTFMDRDANRDALYAKVLNFNRAFFQKPKANFSLRYRSSMTTPGL